MRYEVQNFLLWNGDKNTAKTQPLSPFRDRRGTNFLDLTKKGKSSDIAHGSIIRVSTVCHIMVMPGIKLKALEFNLALRNPNEDIP